MEAPTALLDPARVTFRRLHARLNALLNHRSPTNTARSALNITTKDTFRPERSNNGLFYMAACGASVWEGER